MKSLSFFSLAALTVAGHAIASPASDNADTHFRAIGSGDVQVLMRGYQDNAQLQWVGGPLDGSYLGKDAIRGVWEKFTGSQGNLTVMVENVQESSNPKGSTVTANLLFVGKMPIKVRYALVYRDNLLVSETWQIDPKLSISAAPVAKTAAY
ncbi:nuclear transport factor 2 family protein [Rhizobacter sp. OV335]|uniref:nuclear transport factor 2 family protein n=1 Tax=Rhizobacter sp. OV335 TaxID=1500264 RepID=UPI00091FE29B|nr:nuclear transport factor 2 family protein [Rhizobacter sp. OV335]SHM23668.1 hypothetical protein SAMN02787076_00794 [Rhizobacter sp. OV335]